MKARIFGMKRLSVLFGSLFVFGALYAQTDAPVNLYFDLPLLMNPARCGLAQEEAESFTAQKKDRIAGSKVQQMVRFNYKNQCAGAFNSESLRILSASYEARFFENRMALGAHIYSNTLNASSMRDISAALAYAYHWDVAADEDGNVLHRLSFGLQAAYRYWGYNTANMQTGSMYDPSYTGGYNPGLHPSEDEFPEKHMFDMHFGIHYTGNLGERWRLNAGVALFHMTRPHSGLTDDTRRVPLRWAAYADAFFMLSPDLRTTGQGSELGFAAYYGYQASEYAAQRAYVIQAGLAYRYHFNSDFFIGASFLFRTEQTFIPQLTLDIHRFTLRFQMEFNANYTYNNLFAIGLSYRF